MKKIILFESHERHENLLPLSYTRPIADFRVGILTIRQKWEKILKCDVSYIADESLEQLFATEYSNDNIFIDATLLPNEELIKAVNALTLGQALILDGEIIAVRWESDFREKKDYQTVQFKNKTNVRRIEYLYDIFLYNGEEIKQDFALITKGRQSQPLSTTNTVIGPLHDTQASPLIFLEKGATVEAATLNTTSGPIYIGVDAQISEGACVRGPFALGENGKISMGAKIYADTTIGPYCKAGGEINNAVLFGYSNKAHDGYLGNAVIGEWCNIGAGTNASNLKNDYSKIRVWNYSRRTFMRTDLQFCGLIMGDHSKIGINGMLNTATVIGVGVNLHGSGFPRTFIPSFLQGSPSAGFTDVPLEKFFQIAERVMARRGKPLTDHDKALFRHVEEMAARFK